ncbi:MAG: hydrogen peroxide-inducible genes activator [Parvularculaceae bacterium]
MIPLPTLRQLQFFTALARRESFSRAADECLVSQSTLSSAIKELESLLGQQLVDRSTRSFSLTPAGEEVAARAVGVLAMSEDLARAVQTIEPLSGPFQLGVIPTIAPFILPRATALFRESYPTLQLYLREDLTAALVERLSAGLLDAALLALPYEIPGAETLEIGEDPFWFACAPEHKLVDRKEMRLEELRSVELLLLEDGHCLRDHAIDACKLRDPGVAATFGATSLFTLAQMVRSGLGATLLPEMAVREGLARASGLVAIPFAPPAPGRKIGLVWRKGSGRREEAEAAAAIIGRALAEQCAAARLYCDAPRFSPN